jgi:autotransporter-associated beta strand protein
MNDGTLLICTGENSLGLNSAAGPANLFLNPGSVVRVADDASTSFYGGTLNGGTIEASEFYLNVSLRGDFNTTGTTPSTINVPVVNMFNGGDFNVAAGATLNVIGQLAGATTFAKTNDGNMTIDRSPTYTGTTTVNGGRLALNGSLTTSTSVTVGNAGVFEMAHSAGFNNVINVPAVTIGANARIDLKNNKLFTASPIGTWNGTAYTGVQGDVQRAYDFGSWDLPGLMTSENDAGPTVGTTTIAVSDGASILFLGATETGMFAGQSVTGATTIAVYTYAGDVNFDGLVDASDYGIIDNYFQFPRDDRLRERRFQLRRRDRCRRLRNHRQHLPAPRRANPDDRRGRGREPLGRHRGCRSRHRSQSSV